MWSHLEIIDSGNIRLGITHYQLMLLRVCGIFPSNIMRHFSVWNLLFSECRRLTLFRWAMTIVTAWKGLYGYDRDGISCPDFCTVCMLRTLHPITPAVSSMWFLLPSVYMLYFPVIPFLWWFHELGIMLWECYYILWAQPPPVLLIIHHL